MSLPLTSANFNRVLDEKIEETYDYYMGAHPQEVHAISKHLTCLKEIKEKGYEGMLEYPNKPNSTCDRLTWEALVKKLLPGYKLPTTGGSRRNKRSRKSGRSARRSKSRKNRRTTRKR